MKSEVKMPKLRSEMEKGVLCAWLKEAGEEVHKGEPLFEIETDKVVEQIEAAEDGRLVETLAGEGDEVNVNEVIAVLEVRD